MADAGVTLDIDALARVEWWRFDSMVNEWLCRHCDQIVAFPRNHIAGRVEPACTHAAGCFVLTVAALVARLRAVEGERDELAARLARGAPKDPSVPARGPDA